MILDSLVKLLLPVGGLYFFIAHNPTWRRKLVIRKLLSAPEEITPFLPEIDRSKLFEAINDIPRDRILLVEGSQGVGKTYCLKKYLTYQYYAHKRPVVYISLRKIGMDSDHLDYHHIADIIDYIGAGPGFHDYSDTWGVLNDCLIKLADRKPIVVMDDAHVFFRENELWNALKLNVLSVNAMSWADNRIAQPIFITSDYMVYSKMRGLSGMRSRMEYMHIDELSEQEFMEYIMNNQEFFQQKIPGDTKHLREEFHKFYKYFSSNLRDLESFMYSDKTMDEFITEGIEGGVQDLMRALNVQEFQKEFRELLKKIAKFENITLGDFEKTHILNSLVSNHILAVSKDKKIHFQKPLLKYSFEKFWG